MMEKVFVYLMVFLSLHLTRTMIPLHSSFSFTPLYLNWWILILRKRIDGLMMGFRLKELTHPHQSPSQMIIGKLISLLLATLM
jgi:hypothetical protein